MVHGKRDRPAHALRLHLGPDPPHAGRHPPPDLGHGAWIRSGRARNAHAGHLDRLNSTHAHTLGRRLPRHGRSPMRETPHMRTPMRRVRGLGAAHSGTGHFWHQRVTSVAGIPLTIALLLIVTALLGRSHAAVVQILASPIVSIIVLLFIINTAYHMWIGMQEIILDYVHDETWKLLSLMANTFFVCAVSLASVYAVLRLSFGVCHGDEWKIERGSRNQRPCLSDRGSQLRCRRGRRRRFRVARGGR